MQTSLDVRDTKPQDGQIKFPCFKLLNLDELFVHVTNLLSEGDIQLIVEYQGRTLIHKEISSSPLNIQKLLIYSPIRIYQSSEVYKDIYNIQDYLMQDYLWT